MTARDAAMLDAKIDGISGNAEIPAELFAVVDVLDAQPMLRRSLSDPSASQEERAALASRLLKGKVSAATLAVVTAIVQSPWSSGNALVKAMERQGVRIVLQTASRDGDLPRVTQELFAVARAVDASPELAAALRRQDVEISAKRSLVDKLLAGKAADTSRELAARAVSARQRTFFLTVGSYLDMAAEIAGETIARVVVARPLDAAFSRVHGL